VDRPRHCRVRDGTRHAVCELPTPSLSTGWRQINIYELVYWTHDDALFNRLYWVHAACRNSCYGFDAQHDDLNPDKMLGSCTCLNGINIDKGPPEYTHGLSRCPELANVAAARRLPNLPEQYSCCWPAPIRTCTLRLLVKNKNMLWIFRTLAV
jgi:hypothetical protein